MYETRVRIAPAPICVRLKYRKSYLRQEFISNYQQAIAVHSQLFAGIAELLKGLEALQMPWGIVTNKAARLTEAFIPHVGLEKAACVISGDTTAHAKPHPAPLLEAAKRLKIPAKECWYVGDDLRDIEAAHAAGMTSVAAAWGYCGATEPTHWKANAIIDTPLELLAIIQAKLDQAA